MVCMLASVGNTWAQGVGGGIKVGVNFAKVSNADDEGDVSMRTGIIGGAFLTFPRGALIAFQPEVLFSQQGAKFTDAGEEFTAKIDEVLIPLLLRVGASNGPAYVLVGPSIGFITSAKFTDGTDEEDFKDDLKSTDIGALVGLGVSVNRFLIEARYNLGLTNLNDDDSEKNKSRVISVLVGVGF